MIGVGTGEFRGSGVAYSLSDSASSNSEQGHEVRFYTVEAHTSHEPGEVMRMVDAQETAGQVRPAAP